MFGVREKLSSIARGGEKIHLLIILRGEVCVSRSNVVLALERSSLCSNLCIVRYGFSLLVSAV